MSDQHPAAHLPIGRLKAIDSPVELVVHSADHHTEFRAANGQCLFAGCDRQRVDGDTIVIDLQLAGGGLPQRVVVLELENSDGGILECRIHQSGGAVFVDVVEATVDFRFQPAA